MEARRTSLTLSPRESFTKVRKPLRDSAFSSTSFFSSSDWRPRSSEDALQKSFCNVTTEELDLQSEEEKKALEEKAEELKGFLTFVKDTLGDTVKEVRLSNELGGAPVCMKSADGMSFEMEKYMKRVNPEFAFTAGRILELNPEHAAVKAMLDAVTADPVKAADYAKLLCCQAQLLADLPLEDPAAYTDLVCKLMN